MCGSMVDIQLPITEIKRAKKEEEEERQKKPQDENIMSASATQGGHNKMVFNTEGLVLVKVLCQEKVTTIDE